MFMPQESLGKPAACLLVLILFCSNSLYEDYVFDKHLAMYKCDLKMGNAVILAF